jgi:hypothetical protein
VRITSKGTSLRAAEITSIDPVAACTTVAWRMKNHRRLVSEVHNAIRV